MKKIIFGIIFIVLIIVNVFIVGELAIRLELFLSGKGGYVWIPDDYLGITHAPNSKFLYEEDFSREFSIRRKTNSLGLVGEQITIKKPDSIFRILVLGDSFTEGLHVTQGRNFCEQLQYLLNKNLFSYGKVFQVLNGGISGASPISELLLLKRDLIKLSPDLIILQMFPNDIFEDNKIAAMSVLDDNGFPVKINKFFMNDIECESKVFNKPSLFRECFYAFKKNILNRSVFFQIISRSQKKMLKKSALNKEMTTKAEYNDDNQFFIIQDYNPLFKDENLRNKAWNNTEKYISAIENLAIKNRAKFFIFLIPPEAQLNLEHYGKHNGYFRKGKPSKYLNERLKQLCDNKHILYLDLLPLFEKNKAKELYYNKDGHTKDYGHSLIAEALFNFIVAEKLLKY